MQTVIENQQAAPEVAAEVLAGLLSPTKRIAPKYFYDQRGSELFTAITQLEEYYIPATERSILEANRAAICERIGPARAVVEPGAGACEKIRWLLPDLAPSVYMPMDISAEHLAESADVLREQCPGLNVAPVACDHSAGLQIADVQALEDPVFFYPGSSIGNFEPRDVVAFLESMRGAMDSGGGLLIGVDTKKDAAVLNAAYNDREGITADFNLNVLAHLNELLDGDFDLANFEHSAFYNAAEGRVEMHLRSRVDQTVSLAGSMVRFARGETVHTENSYKYAPEEFVQLARKAGLADSGLWQDARRYFAVMYFAAV
ncbi:MAG: L-histidine N(alpha)-methyltransferase [Gammaproteobacteria bacterium]|jgi:dimethylhistidine N-methyltransferase|nr:L-histidine N(alpha)-methyltransferase [Gammaproteobacteria bacterium]